MSWVTVSFDASLPWRAFDVHAAPWRAVIRTPDHEDTVTGPELLDMVAAAEIGRDPRPHVHAAVRARVRSGRAYPFRWRGLCDGPPIAFPTRHETPGEWSLARGLADLELELLELQVRSSGA